LIRPLEQCERIDCLFHLEPHELLILQCLPSYGYKSVTLGDSCATPGPPESERGVEACCSPCGGGYGFASVCKRPAYELRSIPAVQSNEACRCCRSIACKDWAGDIGGRLGGHSHVAWMQAVRPVLSTSPASGPDKLQTEMRNVRRQTKSGETVHRRQASLPGALRKKQDDLPHGEREGASRDSSKEAEGGESQQPHAHWTRDAREQASGQNLDRGA
jgi:hypothetical protein